jgi:hypothetical protein
MKHDCRRVCRALTLIASGLLALTGCAADGGDSAEAAQGSDLVDSEVSLSGEIADGTLPLPHVADGTLPLPHVADGTLPLPHVADGTLPLPRQRPRMDVASSLPRRSTVPRQ